MLGSLHVLFEDTTAVSYITQLCKELHQFFTFYQYYVF